MNIGAELRPPQGIQAQRPAPSTRCARTTCTTYQWRYFRSVAMQVFVEKNNYAGPARVQLPGD